jgi:hypothetical protein
LYKVSKSLLVLQNHFGLLPNEREGIYVIEFSSPGIWSEVIGHVPCNFSLSASARMRCADTIKPRVAKRRTHPTVGELSLNSATLCSRRSPHTDSMTSHRNSSPAISKSELCKFVVVIEFPDSGGPFPPENCRDARLIFAENHTASSMRRCVAYANIVWPTPD